MSAIPVVAMPDDIRHDPPGEPAQKLPPAKMTHPSSGTSTVWLTYAELATSRGISVRSAQRLAQRHKWRRRPGNDGTARVEVPEGAEQPTDRPQGDDRGGVAYVVATLKEAFAATVAAKDGEIAALRGQLDMAERRATGAEQQAAQLREAVAKADHDRDAAVAIADGAVRAAEELRQTDEARRGQGRWARLRAAWRGE